SAVFFASQVAICSRTVPFSLSRERRLSRNCVSSAVADETIMMSINREAGQRIVVLRGRDCFSMQSAAIDRRSGNFVVEPAAQAAGRSPQSLNESLAIEYAGPGSFRCRSAKASRQAQLGVVEDDVLSDACLRNVREQNFHRSADQFQVFRHL